MQQTSRFLHQRAIETLRHSIKFRGVWWRYLVVDAFSLQVRLEVLAGIFSSPVTSKHHNFLAALRLHLRLPELELIKALCFVCQEVDPRLPREVVGEGHEVVRLISGRGLHGST